MSVSNIYINKANPCADISASQYDDRRKNSALSNFLGLFLSFLNH